MRTRLPGRREAMTFDFRHADGEGREYPYRASIGFVDGITGGTIGEIFLNAKRVDSMLDVLASEAAIQSSHHLQLGVSFGELQAMLKRNADGSPASPLGTALMMAHGEREKLIARLAPNGMPALARHDRVAADIAGFVRAAVAEAAQ